MAENLIDKYIYHLEIMGYELTKAHAEKNLYIANHEEFPNLIISVAQELIVLRASYAGIDPRAAKSKEFHSALNTVNSESSVTKWFYDVDEDDEMSLIIETSDFEYEKKTFTKLISLMNHEIMSVVPVFSNFFLDE